MLLCESFFKPFNPKNPQLIENLSLGARVTRVRALRAQIMAAARSVKVRSPTAENPEQEEPQEQEQDGIDEQCLRLVTIGNTLGDPVNKGGIPGQGSEDSHKQEQEDDKQVLEAVTKAISTGSRHFFLISLFFLRKKIFFFNIFFFIFLLFYKSENQIS